VDRIRADRRIAGARQRPQSRGRPPGPSLGARRIARQILPGGQRVSAATPQVLPSPNEDLAGRAARWAHTQTHPDRWTWGVIIHLPARQPRWAVHARSHRTYRQCRVGRSPLREMAPVATRYSGADVTAPVMPCWATRPMHVSRDPLPRSPSALGDGDAVAAWNEPRASSFHIHSTKIEKPDSDGYGPRNYLGAPGRIRTCAPAPGGRNRPLLADVGRRCQVLVGPAITGL
jgi:hypothetical protein